jgi:hypothetical protein
LVEELGVERRVQREESGTGVDRRSVPATLAVKPEMKWHMAWLVLSRATGGSTPKASQVRKMEGR